MCTYYTLQYTLFSLFQVLYTKYVLYIPYSTPYFHFFKYCTPNMYLLYPSIHLIFTFSCTVHQMCTYYTLQYTLFSLFQVLYTKCVPTIPYRTHYFHFFKYCTPNAYLLYPTVHLIFTFSSAVHQMRTYNTLQYTVFSLFQVLYTKCVPTIPYITPYFHSFKYCTPNAYLLYPTVHLIFTFSRALQQMGTYYTLQYTLFILF